MGCENILKLEFMLSRVIFFHAFNLPILFHLQLVDIFIQLCNLVHESFILPMMLSHLDGILLEETIFLAFDLLQRCHFLGDLGF